MALADSVDRLLARASPIPADEQVVGVVAPHAGHRYSGAVAGSAFGLLTSSQPTLVAIVSPFHGPHPAGVVLSSHSHYRTPLGEVAVDVEALSRLESDLTSQAVRVDRVSRDGEHSLEIELPFLQRSLRAPFHLLPVMIRDQIGRAHV